VLAEQLEARRDLDAIRGVGQRVEVALESVDREVATPDAVGALPML